MHSCSAEAYSRLQQLEFVESKGSCSKGRLPSFAFSWTMCLTELQKENSSTKREFYTEKKGGKTAEYSLCQSQTVESQLLFKKRVPCSFFLQFLYRFFNSKTEWIWVLHEAYIFNRLIKKRRQLRLQRWHATHSWWIIVGFPARQRPRRSQSLCSCIFNFFHDFFHLWCWLKRIQMTSHIVWCWIHSSSRRKVMSSYGYMHTPSNPRILQCSALCATCKLFSQCKRKKKKKNWSYIPVEAWHIVWQQRGTG